MNARDQIKPKSIRLSILQALSDGAITTIDDLQIKMDEPRKKVATNVYPTAIEGLIKRIRDDVTGGPAYQITAQGREYLAKYSSGNAEEPSFPEVPVCANSQTAAVTPGVKVDQALKAAQGHIETLNGTIAQLGKEKAAFSAEIDRLSEKLKAWAGMAKEFGCETPEQIADSMRRTDRLINESQALIEARALIETDNRKHSESLNKVIAPVGYVVQRPAKVLVRVTKRERAEERALCFARREGKRAKVFALIPVGESVPGAEWREA